MKLHIGCGKRYLKDWVNADIKSDIADVRFDARKVFPFDNGTCKFIYCEHLIEHLTPKEGIFFLSECKRVLTRGGVLRISTPNLDYIADKYIHSADRLSICNWINTAFSEWGHKYIYNKQMLRTTLQSLDFMVYQRLKNQSAYPELRNLESRPDQNEIIMDAMA